jgi:hypothetical protein
MEVKDGVREKEETTPKYISQRERSQLKTNHKSSDQSQPKLSNWLIGQGLSYLSASIDQTGKE